MDIDLPVITRDNHGRAPQAVQPTNVIPFPKNGRLHLSPDRIALLMGFAAVAALAIAVILLARGTKQPAAVPAAPTGTPAPAPAIPATPAAPAASAA